MADDNTIGEITPKKHPLPEALQKNIWKEGQSGNPLGRPVGSGISITTEIKKKLAEVPEGQKATYLQLLINRIMKQAIQDGDERMISRIWAYIDGMPKIFQEVTGRDGQPLIVEIIEDKVHNNTEDKNTEHS